MVLVGITVGPNYQVNYRSYIFILPRVAVKIFWTHVTIKDIPGSIRFLVSTTSCAVLEYHMLLENKDETDLAEHWGDKTLKTL